MKCYCNECSKETEFKNLNDLEQDELVEQNSFVCSDCINKEMLCACGNNIKNDEDIVCEECL